jgi:hypothetical protein
VNGSNLVRKEMTTADDRMGDLQSDEILSMQISSP